jgi:pyruvate-formate lyase-activating enzyme
MNATHPLPGTRVRCLRCGVTHAAVFEREDGQVFGRVDCPDQPEKVRLSSDAELYLALRSKSRCPAPVAAQTRRSVINLLPITDTCDFRCPVCYAACEPQPAPAHLSVAEAAERARSARANGARAICLTGGEPTMHPDLLPIVRAVRAKGARVFLITNGLRLGIEPGLAPALHAAGVSKVDLQFDTLTPEVHRQLRGNAFIEEKVRAAKNVLAAGIRLGTVTTVTRLNLPEVSRLIAFGLSLGPGIKTIMFQTAAPVGRFELSREHLVDKEQILRQILACAALPGPTLEDIWPFPHVEPWGMRVHPDCGVSLVLFRDGRGGRHLARESIDLARLNEALHGLGGRRHWWARNLGPLRCLLTSARRGRRLSVLRNLAGFLRGGQKASALVIGVSSFCPPRFIDEMRLGGCATAELRAGGPISPCACYLTATASVSAA